MMNTWGSEYGAMMGPFMMIIFTVLLVLPFWRICKKAGYNGALALFILIPFVNMIFLYWLAFAEWPRQSGQERKQNVID